LNNQNTKFSTLDQENYRNNNNGNNHLFQLKKQNGLPNNGSIDAYSNERYDDMP